MNKKIISVLFIVIALILIFIDYKLIEYYYELNIYDVNIICDDKEIKFEENEDSISISLYLKNNTRRAISYDKNIFLSYHILDEDRNSVEYENKRIDIDKIYCFGESNQISFIIDRPEKKGNYIIQIDLVEENIAWFSRMGNEVHEILITV